METDMFIGKGFWSFFMELSPSRRSKRQLAEGMRHVSLLVTDNDGDEQYKVVCECQWHVIHGDCPEDTLKIAELGVIVSIERVFWSNECNEPF